MRVHLLAAAAIVSAAAAGVAFAALPKSKALAIMHERHEGMETIGRANKSLRRELESSSPDLTVVRLSAAQLAQLARKSSGWFPAGTGPERGKTAAKPEIWRNPKDFAAKNKAFQNAAQMLRATASAGSDIGAIKARYAALGRTCASCHDKYRAEMKH